MDHIIEHRRLDIIVVEKTKKKAQIVDFAVPAVHRIEIPQNWKLWRSKMWTPKVKNLKISVVLIVVGALGTIPKSLEKHLNEFGSEHFSNRNHRYT